MEDQGSVEEFDACAHNYKEVQDQTLKFSGDGVEYFAEYKALYAARQMGEGFKGSILDFGCGIGLLSKFLVRHMGNASLDGFDVASKAIEQIPDAIRKRGTFTHDPKKLKSHYDLIIVANVFHHIVKDKRQETMDMLAGMLAKNGTLMVFEHNPLNPITRKIVRECIFDRGVILLNPREVSGYMKNAGLEGIGHDYTLFFPRIFSALRPMEPSLSWCPLGAQFVVSARKETS